MQRPHLVLLFALPVLFLNLTHLGFVSQRLDPVSGEQPPQDQAEQAIAVAQTAINTAYASLVFADSAGSPIDDLIGTLNGAIVDLTQARQAYNQSDFSTALTLAEGAHAKAIAVSDEAQLRGVTTTTQTQALFMLVIAIIVLSIPVTYFVTTHWQQYRKEKRREFLRMEIRLPDEKEEDETS